MKQDWTYKKLGEVATAKITDLLWFQEGPGVRKNQYTEDGVKLLNVANLVNGTVDLSTSSRYISEEEAYGKYRHFLVDEGDLIIASSGIQVSYFDKKMGFVTADQLPLCMNTSTIRFKVLDESITDIKYFMYYLKSFPFKRQLAKYITGSAQLNFGPSHLKQMSMPLYPLATQRSIVSELDLLHSLIEKKQEQLRALDNLAQSLFYQMFGDPITNPMGWQVKKLGEVAPVKPCQKEIQSENGLFWLLNLDMVESQTGKIIEKNMVTKEEIGNSTTSFSPDNVLYSKLRPYLNKVVLPNNYGYCTTELLPLLPMSGILTREYLCYLLRSNTFVEYINIKVAGAKMPRVTMNDFRKFPLPLPPLSLQQSFAAKVSAIEEQKQAVQQSIREIEALLAERMDNYFG